MQDSTTPATRSRQYLEELRNRRTGRRASTPTQTPPQQQTTNNQTNNTESQNNIPLRQDFAGQEAPQPQIDPVAPPQTPIQEQPVVTNPVFPVTDTNTAQRVTQNEINQPEISNQQEMNNNAYRTPQNAQQPSAYQESEIFPGQFTPIPEEIIVEWQAPNRPFKKRDKQYYTTIAVIVLLVSLILFFAGQFLPIAVVVSVGFLAYVISAIPPQEVTNKITTWGIRIDNEIFYWEEMGRFWYEPKFGKDVLYIEILRFPGRITLMIEDLNQEDLTMLLSEVLLQQKPEPTPFDKAADWLQKRIPLDTN